MYWLHNFAYMGNIGFFLFILSMFWSVVSNVKQSMTYPLRLKLGSKGHRWDERSWTEVFIYIFKND